MQKFRAVDANVVDELMAISHSLKGPSSLESGKTEHAQKPRDFLERAMQRKFRRPFLILNGLFLLMTFSGKFAIAFYAVDIFVMAHSALDAVVALIDDIVAAKADGVSDEALAEAMRRHRIASFLADYIESENSSGFHADQESMRILAEAIDQARLGQAAVREAIDR